VGEQIGRASDLLTQLLVAFIQFLALVARHIQFKYQLGITPQAYIFKLAEWQPHSGESVLDGAAQALSDPVGG
jgi:hypothetical protein